MNIEAPQTPESSPDEVEVHNPTTGWETVRDKILLLEQDCFGEAGFSEEELRASFESAQNVVVLLRQGGRIIGFSIAVPDAKVAGALYVNTTDILREERGKRHVVSLMHGLEEEARARGYKFLTRNAVVGNGYADKIMRSYEGRILETYENESEWGPQRYFKISLDT
ncbi:MAG TPA: GNAT family N-acetyltransferase [Candidatus Paceibacterota bacterium]|jgi:hypothetical protein